MDKKKQLKHTANKAKEQSIMEKMNHKSKSIQDILPLDLIHRILLRLPVRHLACLRCFSKLWHSLISDPHFAELHFHHSPASTNASVFVGGTVASFVYLDALFTENTDALQVKEVSPPFQMKRPPSVFEFLGSCRGFVLLHRDPHFLVVWNPLTGSGKRISYSHIVSRCKHEGIRLPCEFHLYGFGYDASQDDYLVVVAWQDKDDHDHFDCFSLRTNSWINLDAALSKPLGVSHRNSCGLFLNGAIHWVPYSLAAYRDAIIIFDMKERTFSRISGPEQPVMSACTFPCLALLGGCLALYYRNDDSYNTHIWVMKEYKVLSSWTLYQIPCKDFRPLCLSSNMDIIGRGYTSCGKIGYFKYNVRGDVLKHFKNYCSLPLRATDPVYTESLLPLPSDIKDKDKKMKKNGDRAPSLTTAGLKAFLKKRKRAEKEGSSTNADKEGGLEVVHGSMKEIEEGPKTVDERQKRLHGYPLEGGTSSPIDVGLVTEVDKVGIGQYLQVIGAQLLSIGRTRELMAKKENFELGEMRKLQSVLKIKDELLNSSREELKKKDEEGKVLAEKVAALEKDVEKTILEKEKLVAQVKELESLLSANEAEVCEVFTQGFERAVLQIKTLLPEADVSAMDVMKVAMNGELVDDEVLDETVDENAAQQQDDEVVQV